MIIRPRKTFEEFVVMRKKSRLDEIGRVHVTFAEVATIKACISSTESFEREKHSALMRDDAIRIISRDKIAQIGDMLVRLERKYLIADVELTPDRWKIYWCQQRYDLN